MVIAGNLSFIPILKKGVCGTSRHKAKRCRLGCQAIQHSPFHVHVRLARPMDHQKWHVKLWNISTWQDKPKALTTTILTRAELDPSGGVCSTCMIMIICTNLIIRKLAIIVKVQRICKYVNISSQLRCHNSTRWILRRLPPIFLDDVFRKLRRMHSKLKA